jgi:hypothetical protein
MVVEVRMELRVRLEYVGFNRTVCCAIREAFTMLCAVRDHGLQVGSREVFPHCSAHRTDVSLQKVAPMTMSDSRHPGDLHDILLCLR